MTCAHHEAASQDATATIAGQCPLCLLSLGLEAETFTPGTIIASRFRIVSLLGRGGMGEVYRADDLKLGQPVALKFLSARGEEAVYDEVRIGRQIAHPNVCRIYDVVEIDGRPFIEMEWIDGEDLASLLARAGMLPYEKALNIGRDVCAALDAAHQKGIVHGDLKPANIMIDGYGRARITDFGLSRLVSDPAQRGVRGGTLSYMAPEQLQGGEATARSDLYALGIVLYEIFTGGRLRMPPPPRLSLRDRALAQTILQCLAVDPQKRPASARQVLDAFPAGDPMDAMIAAGETPSPEIVAASRAVTALRPIHAWLLLIAFVAALAALVIITPRIALPLAPKVLAQWAHAMSQRDFVDDDQWFERSGRRLEFHWRGSPSPMLPLAQDGRVRADDPPLQTIGMVHVVLDPSGKLLRFEFAPAAHSASRVPSSRLPHVVYVFLLTATLLAGAWLARRNLRAGRVDRKAATRVALWVFSCRAIFGLLAGHHPLTIEKEASFLAILLGASLLLATEVWLGYVALEPLVRRIAPHALITWARVQQGRVRDAVVGRDVLIGLLVGVAIRLLDPLRDLPTNVDALGSIRITIAMLIHAQARAIFYALFALFLLILLRIALRHWIAASIVWLAATTLAWSGREDALIVAAQMLLLLILLRRFGLLAAAIAIFVQVATLQLPHSLLAPTALVALAIYGFSAARNTSPRSL